MGLRLTHERYTLQASIFLNISRSHVCGQRALCLSCNEKMFYGNYRMFSGTLEGFSKGLSCTLLQNYGINDLPIELPKVKPIP